MEPTMALTLSEMLVVVLIAFGTGFAGGVCLLAAVSRGHVPTSLRLETAHNWPAIFALTAIAAAVVIAMVAR